MRNIIKHGEENMLTVDMVNDQGQMMHQVYRNVFLAQNVLKAYVYLITWFVSEFCKT